MLLVVFQLSRDVIGHEDSNWRDTTTFDSEDNYRTGCQKERDGTWSRNCQQQYLGTGQDNHSPPTYELTPEFLNRLQFKQIWVINFYEDRISLTQKVFSNLKRIHRFSGLKGLAG